VALAPKPIERLRDLPCGQTLLTALAAEQGVWIVGGAVRDLLLGREPSEIDLVTTRKAADVGQDLGEIVEQHDRFGTVKAIQADCRFDVAQTRSETYPSPGALPTVQLGTSLLEDLARRDFTINAIAISLDGELTQHPGALADLESGVLKVLHDRSFVDDPTRLWRLIRYSVRLGFRIDPHTSELATAAVAGGALGTVSQDRIGSELRLALNEPDPLATLHAAQNLGLTPRLDLAPAVIGAALEILPAGARTDLLIVGAAVADDGWISTLGFTADEIDVLRKCISVRGAPDGQPSEIAVALRGLPDEAVALSGARGNREAAERWLLELRDIGLEITGDDLISAGITEGPEIGERLARTLAVKLDGRVSGREAELAEALR
jgi:tRNA nucleotidyltransferase (CCA-adding enzyme)